MDDSEASLIAAIVAGIVGVAMVACVIITLLWRRPEVEDAGDVQLENLVPAASGEKTAPKDLVVRAPSSDSSGDPQQQEEEERVDLESSASSSAVSLEE